MERRRGTARAPAVRVHTRPGVLCVRVRSAHCALRSARRRASTAVRSASAAGTSGFTALLLLHTLGLLSATSTLKRTRLHRTALRRCYGATANRAARLHARFPRARASGSDAHSRNKREALRPTEVLFKLPRCAPLSRALRLARSRPLTPSRGATCVSQVGRSAAAHRRVLEPHGRPRQAMPQCSVPVCPRFRASARAGAAFTRRRRVSRHARLLEQVSAAAGAEQAQHGAPRRQARHAGRAGICLEDRDAGEGTPRVYRGPQRARAPPHSPSDPFRALMRATRRSWHPWSCAARSCALAAAQ